MKTGLRPPSYSTLNLKMVLFFVHIGRPARGVNQFFLNLIELPCLFTDVLVSCPKMLLFLSCKQFSFLLNKSAPCINFDGNLRSFHMFMVLR